MFSRGDCNFTCSPGRVSGSLLILTGRFYCSSATVGSAGLKNTFAGFSSLAVTFTICCAWRDLSSTFSFSLASASYLACASSVSSCLIRARFDLIWVYFKSYERLSASCADYVALFRTEVYCDRKDPFIDLRSRSPSISTPAKVCRARTFARAAAISILASDRYTKSSSRVAKAYWLRSISSAFFSDCSCITSSCCSLGSLALPASVPWTLDATSRSIRSSLPAGNASIL